VSKEIQNPLQGLIAQIAKSTPRVTGESDRVKARFAGAGEATVILADTSGSMAEPAGAGVSKIDLLREALAGCWPEIPGAILYGFDAIARPAAQPSALTAPAGGTALHLGLDAAAAHRPRRTLVISDGQPDDEAAALASAARLTGVVDVIYVGPDSDTNAIAFMRKLATATGGRVVVRDVRRESRPALAREVRAILGLPAPKGG
jgi:Mg-chelatase subunit ChlD